MTVVALVTFAALPAWGQNFRRYQPQLPENTEGQAELPDEEREPTGDPRILVAELKGLVFLDSQDRVVQRPEVRQGVYVDSSGLWLLHSQAFRGVVGPYLGGPVSIRRLNEMVQDIIRFYRRNDQPVVDVSVPEQDITEGMVQVVVTEGRIGHVRVEGARYFNPWVLLRESCMTQGSPIYESMLLEDLRWLNRNPFREVDLELTPGTARGTTDVVYNVRDRKPLRVYMGYDDTGTRPTGLERTFYGFNWGNAFWRDHQLGYQFTGSSDFKKLNAHSFVYSIPLLNRDTVDFWGSYAEVSSPFAVPFTSDGQAWQAAFRYNHELCPRGYNDIYRHRLVSGFDFKVTNTNLEFGGINVFPSSADIPQFVLGYRGGWADGYAGMSMGVDGVYGFSGLAGGNTDADYQTIRAGAQADYFYSRAWWERRWWLPLDWTFVTRMTGQVAEGNLLPSEQLGFGGFDSVRGYDMRLVNGDSGYLGSVELRTPAMNLGLANDQLQFLTFLDYGDARNHTLLPGEDPSVDLSGTGLGLRYILNPEILLRVDYGWQIEQISYLPTPRERWHVGVVIAH